MPEQRNSNHPPSWAGALAAAPLLLAVALIARAPDGLAADAPPGTAASAAPHPASATSSARVITPTTRPLGVLDLLPEHLPPGASLERRSGPGWVPGVGTAEPERLSGHGPSTVVIPVQTIPLLFDHKRHLETGLVTCTDCHTRAPTSRWSSDWLLPTEEPCRKCHAIDRSDFSKKASPPANCASCHVGFDEVAEKPTLRRVDLPSPHLKFPHAVHVTERKIACERCHRGVSTAGFADRDALPRMALCLEACHNGRVAPDGCATCHFTDKDGTLTLEFREGTLAPMDALRGMGHIPGWELTHGAIAAADPATCMSCHREEECAICHDGVARPSTIHTGDYTLIHAVDARRSAPDCQACHRLQTFCLTCHARTGVSLVGEDVRGRLRFHAPGWAALVPGPNHHSVEARKSPTPCVGCHLERDCTTCHAEIDLFCFDDPRKGSTCLPGLPPAGGIDPHPPGFRARCKSFLRRNVAACLRCHAARSAAIEACGDR